MALSSSKYKLVIPTVEIPAMQNGCSVVVTGWVYGKGSCWCTSGRGSWALGG